MRLSDEDANLFFKLMWGLQFYVNEQRQILPHVKSVEEYGPASSLDKVQVRDALWENPDLIDTYVKENPNGLSEEELAIVLKWKGFVPDTFQIFRQLKEHAIFIGEHAEVYGVVGLTDGLEEVLYGQPLPIMAQAVLLPFKGKVIYDGLLKPYSISFGSGIRSSLKEQYLAAKQQGRIIKTLEPELVKETPKKRSKPERDWRAETDKIVELTEKMKGGPAVQSAAFGLLRASARLSQTAVHCPDDPYEIWELGRQVQKSLTRLRTTLERAGVFD